MFSGRIFFWGGGCGLVVVPVDLFNPDDTNFTFSSITSSRLLLQVESFPEDFNQKGLFFIT